jgi:hypothetical protein
MWLSTTQVPLSLGTDFPRLIERLSQLWKGRAEENALLGKEGRAVKLECQECGKVWLRPAGGWEQSLSKSKLVHGRIIKTTYYDICKGVPYQGPIR